MPIPLLAGLGGLLGSPLGKLAVGSLAPSALSGIGSYLFGGEDKPDEFKQAQMNLLRSLQRPSQFQSVGFGPQEERARQQFQQQTVPSLAERFTGIGGQRSSAFGQQLGGAAADLESQLAGMRGQHELGQQQAQMQHQGLEQSRLSQLMNMLQGQQETGLRQQQLGQQGRQFGISSLIGGLGKLGELGLGAGQLASRHQLGLRGLQQNLLGQATGFGTQPSYQAVQQQAQPGFLQSAGPGLIGGALRGLL